MKRDIYWIPIGKLKTEIVDRAGRIYKNNELHHCTPLVGGYGIVKVAALVPQSKVLFVTPMGCARHGALAAHASGVRHKVVYLFLNHSHIVMGDITAMLEKAIVALLQKEPLKAVTICSTCIDDLLGTDYEAMTAQLEEQYPLKVRIGKMNPIMIAGKKPPHPMIQDTIYSYLEKSKERNSSMNVIGSFSNMDPRSEIHHIVKSLGCESLKHIADFNEFDQFMKMSSSSLNIVIREQGLQAARNMEKKLGIPFLYLPAYFRPEGIAQNYETLWRTAGKKGTIGQYQTEANNYLEENKKYIEDVQIAVGSSNNAFPFELARFLIELGARVDYIFADNLLKADHEHVDWLAENAPHIKVVPTLDPSVQHIREASWRADVGIGLDSAYFTHAGKHVSLDLGEQLYGFQGSVELIRRIINAGHVSEDWMDMLIKSSVVI